MQISSCRIDGVKAASANCAWLFRRGPHDFCQILIWDFTTDAVTPVGWVKGKVFTRNCDVSFDGKYAVIMARGQLLGFPDFDEKSLPGWTAIIQASTPYLIALWGAYGTYHGGGIWFGERDLQLDDDPHTWEKAIVPPEDIHVFYRAEGILDERMKKFGWNANSAEFPGYEKTWSGGTIRFDDLGEDPLTTLGADGVRKFNRVSGARERWTVADTEGKVRLTLDRKKNHPGWIEVDDSGRLVYADGGCLWAWSTFPKGKPELIADLNLNRPIEQSPTMPRFGEGNV